MNLLAENSPGRRALVRALFALAIAVLCALMWLNVDTPLHGDQALYLFGARQMSEGAVLYRDFWDIKAPGVYAFYWLAGSLFGFSAIGLHVLEMIWLGAAAALTFRICSIATRGSPFAFLGPLFTLGSYLVAATPWHLTQPDGLLTLPLTLTAWTIVEPRLRLKPLHRWMATGAAAGLAAMFVTAAALIGFAFLATALIVSARTAGAQRNHAPAGAAGFAAGMLVVFAIPLVWFASHGALGDYLWTIWSYPLAAQGEFARDVPKFIESVKWFLRAVAMLIPCALMGVVALCREFWQREERSLVGLLMCAWFAAGGVALLIQYHYSWQFHFNHFFVPAGVLATIGVAEILGVARSTFARVATAGLLILALVLPVLLVKKLVNGTATASADSSFEESVRRGLGDATADDSVYVLGDPRVLLAAGLPQPVKENGWALEVLLSNQWKDFSAALRQSGPTYIYVTRGYPELLARNAPELQEWLARDYEAVHTDAMKGTWLRRRDRPAATRIPSETR